MLPLMPFLSMIFHMPRRHLATLRFSPDYAIAAIDFRHFRRHCFSF
jgi:hypothetical protein